jgi:hypothetical protein
MRVHLGEETYVHTRWLWLILPMILALMSLFFLLSAIWIIVNLSDNLAWFGKSYRTRHRDQPAKRNGRSSKANEGQVETDFRQKSQPYAHWKSGRML